MPEDDGTPLNVGQTATTLSDKATDGPIAVKPKRTGSLSRRMIGIAAAWILFLLVGGGFALDNVLTGIVTRNFDSNLEYVLRAMIRTSEIDENGEVQLREAMSDQRFLEPYSGLYFQISGKGHDPFPSRSLWDSTLRSETDHSDGEIHAYNSRQLPGEELRILERDVYLPGSKTLWRYQIAQSRTELDEQIKQLRRTLVRSFAILAIGLIMLAALQTLYGLWPLRRIRHAIGEMRRGERNRVTDSLPNEVMPMVDELNELLAHNERQAEEARRHAGNLAHALKTPLTVIMNAATAQSADLAETVIREATTMRRQVDHHLARARAVGRRGHAHSRAQAWQSLQSVERAVSVLYPNVRIDSDGDKNAAVRVERQDLDELLGNLVENAAKYGGGSVFVTIAKVQNMVEIVVEDDGPGIPAPERLRIFDRGARLDTGKPGTGLGLAIVRDVAEIYDGSVGLEESEDMGGLLVRLRLPSAN